MNLLPYERIIDSEALSRNILTFEGEHVLALRPYGWHLDGRHIPNAAEHFSRETVCVAHGWEIVCEFGPYVAVVRQTPEAGEGTKGVDDAL